MKQYDVFVSKYQSADQIPVIIGGICEVGSETVCCQAFEAVKNNYLSLSRDIYAVDYILSESVAKASPKEALVVGATVHIPQVTERTGGIVGNPHAPAESCDGEIEWVNDDIFVVAFPGGPGAACVGSKEKAQQINAFLNQNFASQEEKIQAFEKKLESLVSIFVLVADGSGYDGSGYDGSGRVIVSCHGKKKSEYL